MTAGSIGRAAGEAAAPSLSIHASAVAIGEAGVLIRGSSGGGKSHLAMGLVFAAAGMRRFASLVGDDRICLENRDGRLIARGHPMILGMVGTRGLGILKVSHEAAVVIRLVADIVAPAEAVRFPDPAHGHVLFCGVHLPVLALLGGTAAADCAISVLAHLERMSMI